MPEPGRYLRVFAGGPLLLAAAGCATPPPPPPPPPPPAGVELTYAVPPQAPLRYTMADTVTITFHGGMLSGVRVEGGYYAALRMGVEAAEDGVRVTAGVEDFTGELRNPMAGTTRANEADVSGDWVIRVEPSGRTEVLERPSVSEGFRSVVGTDDLLRNFFIRLPRARVRPGDTWTDTIRVDEPTPTGRETSISVVTSTLLGDTLVGADTLQAIRSETRTTLHIQATTDATEVVQDLEGITTALTLFDPERHIIVRSDEEGVLEGTIDVPDAGILQVPLEARVRRHLVWVPPR